MSVTLTAPSDRQIRQRVEQSVLARLSRKIHANTVRVLVNYLQPQNSAMTDGNTNLRASVIYSFQS